MTQGVFGGVGPSEEVWEKIRLAVEDEWPMSEIIETYKVSFRTIKKRHPGYKGAVGYRKLQQDYGERWGKAVAA